MKIEFSRVSVRFDERTILENLSLTLTEQRIGVVGANGSGKSTLVRLINGLASPTNGEVRVDGVAVGSNPSAVRRRVGFVFTNPDSQIVMPTVREDIAFSLRRSGLPRAEQDDRVTAALAEFGLTHLANQSAHRLSGGQKQLLALAAIFVSRPELVIADEPTTLLDARNARMMMERFAALPQQLIIATHHLETLADFDRVIVLDEGRIVADDAPATALSVYRQLVSA